MSVQYFCYGSNLLTKRIKVGLKDATKLCIGILDDYKLTFSGYSDLWKGATANIIQCNQSKVIGVVWSITYKDLEQLNVQERGYRLTAITVRGEEGQLIECITYVQTILEIERGKATLDEQDGLPSDVYQEVIVKGAIEHNLPEPYIQMIKSFSSKSADDCQLSHLIK